MGTMAKCGSEALRIGWTLGTLFADVAKRPERRSRSSRYRYRITWRSVVGQWKIHLPHLRVNDCIALRSAVQNND